MARSSVIDEQPADSLWRNRDFVLLWSGQAVSTLGTRFSGLALPLLVLAVTYSPAQAGLIGALSFLPYLVFGLPAGALVDRWDRKRTMALCDLARCIAFGSVPLAVALGRLTMPQLYLVALVDGTSFVLIQRGPGRRAAPGRPAGPPPAGDGVERNGGDGGNPGRARLERRDHRAGKHDDHRRGAGLPARQPILPRLGPLAHPHPHALPGRAGR